MKTDDELRERDKLLAAVDAILEDAGINGRNVGRFGRLKGRILELVDAPTIAARGEGEPEAKDPYMCSGCGAGLWCASMEHTLDSCESGCRFWVEDPRNQSAWCCAGSPAGECDEGRSCTECGCMEAEAEGGARREAEAPHYAIVTADQGGYYVSAPIATVTQAVALARLQGTNNFSGPAPGVVMQEAEGRAWGPAPSVNHCTECLLPFEAEGDETGGEWDECPTCRAEMEAEL